MLIKVEQHGFYQYYCPLQMKKKKIVLAIFIFNKDLAYESLSQII